MKRNLVVALAALSPVPALATDYTGMATLFVGFPAVIAALISNGLVALMNSPGKAIRGINGAISVLFVVSAAFVMGDVIGMFGGNDRVAAVVYVLLSVLTLVLVFRNFQDKA